MTGRPPRASVRLASWRIVGWTHERHCFVLALLTNREQWQDLCADPPLLADRAVEETLRFDPPVQLTGRVALEPVELEGKTVGRGQRVLTLIGGANRDPEVYAEPGTFSIRRDSPAEHLAFSAGIHYDPRAPAPARHHGPGAKRVS